MEENKVGSSPS